MGKLSANHKILIEILEKRINGARKNLKDFHVKIGLGVDLIA